MKSIWLFQQCLLDKYNYCTTREYLQGKHFNFTMVKNKGEKQLCYLEGN